MIELTCKYCRRTVQQHGGEMCDACSAKGVGLRQIKKVEKWEARDGTFHDSLEAAQTHQLMAEVTTALRACEGRPDSQARHLLSHFDIVRKGDTPKVWYGPVTNTPYPEKKVMHFWSFFWGCALTATCSIIFLHFAG